MRNGNDQVFLVFCDDNRKKIPLSKRCGIEAVIIARFSYFGFEFVWEVASIRPVEAPLTIGRGKGLLDRGRDPVHTTE